MNKRAYLTPLTIVVVILFALVAWLLLKPQNEGGNQDFINKPTVVVAEARVMEFRDTIQGLGTAQASESVNVMARVSQTVREIHFSDGQDVKKGDLLIVLNDREERARVQELEFRLAEAKRQLDRLRELAKRNAASTTQIDEQEVRVEQTTAELAVAQSRLEEMQIKAPFQGRLGIRQVSLGSLVRSGDVITTLDALHPIYVDFSVPELYLPSLTPGLSVTAQSVAYDNRTFEGKIKSLASRVDPVTRAIQVRAELDNSSFELRPGMLLHVELERRVDYTLMIAEGAIIPIRNEHYAYIIDEEGRASMVEVEIGRRQPGWVEILGGISEGDQVIVEGTIQVRDGLPVNTTER